MRAALVRMQQLLLALSVLSFSRRCGISILPTALSIMAPKAKRSIIKLGVDEPLPVQLAHMLVVSGHMCKKPILLPVSNKAGQNHVDFSTQTDWLNLVAAGDCFIYQSYI